MRDIVRKIGVRERDTARWKLEKRDRSSFPGRGGRRERKEGDRQTLFTIRAAVLVIPWPAGL